MRRSRADAELRADGDLSLAGGRALIPPLVDDRMAVWINWEGIARMLGWTGSIEELKKLRIERPSTKPHP